MSFAIHDTAELRKQLGSTIKTEKVACHYVLCGIHGTVWIMLLDSNAVIL